jgi:hypothetical protein
MPNHFAPLDFTETDCVIPLDSAVPEHPAERWPCHMEMEIGCSQCMDLDGLI